MDNRVSQLMSIYIPCVAVNPYVVCRPMCHRGAKGRQVRAKTGKRQVDLQKVCRHCCCSCDRLEMAGRWRLPQGHTVAQQSRGLEQESARMEPIN